ncbi:MAG TPA: zinc ribbon domain-containing protein [Pseudomonadales bacterium]|nr:zinc ribbon domain-containing protein [Pseudomonadales bacterium]
MPIYEYQCAACGHQLEAIQKFSAAPLTDCPACNKAELKKQISAPAFRLNGAGWYETDFKTGKKKNLAGDSVSTANDNTNTTKADSSTPATPSVA